MRVSELMKILDKVQHKESEIEIRWGMIRFAIEDLAIEHNLLSDNIKVVLEVAETKPIYNETPTES